MIITHNLPVTECILIWMEIICKMTINLMPNEDSWKMPLLESFVLLETEDALNAIKLSIALFKSIFAISEK